MQVCLQIQDFSMTFRRLQTHLWGILIAFMVILLTLRVHLIAPFRNGVLTPPMMEFNQSMSTVRVSVEWPFNDITNYFKFWNLKKKLKNWP